MAKYFYLVVAILFTVSCSSDKSGNAIQVTNVFSSELNQNAELQCSNFRLTQEEAQVYFNKAKKVADITANDTTSSCAVKGEGILSNEHCTWEIRQGGAGQVSCEGQSFQTACVDCLPVSS